VNPLEAALELLVAQRQTTVAALMKLDQELAFIQALLKQALDEAKQN